ncbi:uncharacterized protein LOC129726953 [Wyeomyia smithii]|uniref:uncharacterized protein LOC129726953 n=1 Tax=Wyeomyia smithii TaxID=174621 RepID=UPI002467FFA3|nr:uncharacterized protein LOC129726953 [Wyeomyia smithii]
MIRYVEWFKESRKNLAQNTTLTTGMLTLVATGLMIGATIFNVDSQHQPWDTEMHSFWAHLITITFYWGAVHGTLAGGFLVERYEKKWISPIYLSLAIVGNILVIAIPDHWASVSFGRALLGIAHGIVYVVVIIHGGEVSVKERRGFNISAVNLCVMIGILTYGLFGPMGTYGYGMHPLRLVGILGLILCVMASACVFTLTQESPLFLIRKERDADAIKMMKIYRGERTETLEIREEYAAFKSMLQDEEGFTKSLIKDKNYRPFLLLGFCKEAAAYSFNMALNVVRLHILNELIDDFRVSAALIMAIRLVMGVAGMFYIDKFGRKAPIVCSTLGSGAILTIMGLLYLVSDHVPLGVAVAAMLAYEVMASSGLTFATDVYSSESVYPKKKAMTVALGIQMKESSSHIMMLSVASSWDLSTDLYRGIIMMLCGVPLLVFSAVFYRWLPETANLSLQQSQRKFLKRRKEWDSISLNEEI